ncbi:MAG: hypothetical protein CL685_03840, partial [Candidatus Magasanikbacteria bacterium]|nr:hypothetical protein [Candidatus Magasanikbacteria bacterium]
MVAMLVLPSYASAVTTIGEDISVGDDVSLISDGAIINFGADSEISLTHSADVGLILNGNLNLTSVSSTYIDALTYVSSTNLYAQGLSRASANAAEDLTVSLTGDTNSSLVLSSTGTDADALQVTASAGGIDISATGAAAGEDIDITATGSSVNLTSTEADGSAIKLHASNAAGGIDADFGTGGFDLDGTGAI